MKNILAHVDAHGGATIKDGKVVTFDSGYQVSICDAYLVLRDDLEKYLKIAMEFAVDYAYVGVWYDEEEKLYCIDYSQRIESLDDALKVGKMMNQKAIYDWKEGDSVDIR